MNHICIHVLPITTLHNSRFAWKKFFFIYAQNCNHGKSALLLRHATFIENEISEEVCKEFRHIFFAETFMQK